MSNDLKDLITEKIRFEYEKRGLITEGLWDAFRNLIEFQEPKHPKYQAMLDKVIRQYDRCEETYPDESTKINVDASTDDGSGGSVSYEHYKENPKKIECQLRARISFYEDFLSWVDSIGIETACSYNRNKPRCINWLTKYIEEAKEDLEHFKTILKRGHLSSSEFDNMKQFLTK